MHGVWNRGAVMKGDFGLDNEENYQEYHGVKVWIPPVERHLTGYKNLLWDRVTGRRYDVNNGPFRNAPNRKNRKPTTIN